MLSNYAMQLLNSSGCCHSVNLANGYVGIYNGLSYWGRVEDGKGNHIETINLDMEIDEEDGSQWQPNFTPSDFVRAGYALGSS